MVVNLKFVLMFLIFVEIFIVWIGFIGGNGFFRRIDGFVNGLIEKIWLWSIGFKFCKDSCNFWRNVIIFFCFDGWKIDKIFMFLSDGIVKKVRNVWLLFFFFFIYICNVLIVIRLKFFVFKYVIILNKSECCKVESFMNNFRKCRYVC